MIHSQYELILYSAKDHISFLTNKVDADLHRHHYIQCTIGLEEDVQLQAEGETFRARGIVIPSHASHQLRGLQKWQWYILINPESAFGESWLQRMGPNLNISLLNEHQVSSMLRLAYQLLDPIHPTAYEQVMKRCRQTLGLCDVDTEPALDDRIREALHYIDEHPLPGLTVGALSRLLYLSESRLSHLFKQEVGITLSSYLVHRKFEAAFHAIFNGSSITAAALEAGFSSSSHFTRTVRDKLGMSPRSIVQNSRYMQV